MIPNQPSSQRTNNHLAHGPSPDPLPRRIKLAGVHSLSKSPAARLLSPRPPAASPPYERLFYHGALFAEGESRTHSLGYESVAEAVEGVAGAEEIQGVKDLEGRAIFSGKERCLVLTSTNEKAMRLVEAVAKKKSKMVDLILLGELRPSGEYLNASVALATSDPRQAIAFLKGNGFTGPSLEAFQRRNEMEVQSMSSSSFRATMLNLMRESEDSVSTAVIARRSHPNREKPAHHWLVDKTATGSFTTTEIPGERVSPEMARLQKRRSQEGEESEVREYDERELRRGAGKNIETKPWKAEQTAKEAVTPKETQPQPAKKMASSSNNYAMNPRAYRHFPSNIISEVSDEYKGSVRESIMSIEPDLSFKSTRQHFPSNLVTHTADPPQEEGNKRAVSGLANASEYRKVENIVNGVQGAPYSATVRYGSSYIPQSGVKTYESSQQASYQPASSSSAARVFTKKEVTQPEEVHSTASITNNTVSPSGTPVPIRQEASTQLVSQQYSPSSYRAINSNRVSEVISSPSLSRQTYSSPIDQLRNITNPPQQQTYASPGREAKVTYTSASGINWDDYEKVESDGRTIYRKKVNIPPTVIAAQTVQVAKQAVEPKTAQNVPKPQEASVKSTEQNQQMPIKAQDSQKSSKAVVSPKKPAPPTQTVSVPNVLMLQSTLKPSPAPPSPIPSVKISAPLPLKQQSTKFTQLTPAKSPKKGTQIQPKPKQANKSNAKKALLNESMFSRMSELHSDGSILRRNNIRFGVKTPQAQAQREQRFEPSMLQSKLSGIYKGPGAARKNTLNRVIAGEEELEEERGRLGHVVTRFNCFHFIVQEELGYLAGTIQAHVATANDRIEAFTGMEQLYERIRPDRVEGKFDAGFIFARRQEARLVNPALLPEDYYTVTIERGEGEAVLEVEEGGRRIRMDQLGRLLLAQRLLIDSKLYQYVAYRSHRREIALLADRFLHTEFILEQVETEFTSEILDFYYCELPRLTRLYLLCSQEELGELVRLVAVYAELNPSFLPESCKIVCLITDILTNEALIMAHPSVTFISNPEDIKSHEDVLRYAHHAEEDQRLTLPADRLFYHRGLQGLEGQLEERFPGRFLAVAFGKLAEVYTRLDKLGKGRGERNYLVLHESLSHERVAVERFARTFMVGKAKAVQPQVARVLNFEELLEVLGK